MKGILLDLAVTFFDESIKEKDQKKSKDYFSVGALFFLMELISSQKGKGN